MPINKRLDELRDALLSLDAVGPKGFEGLVATALADLTGLTFRLAKSGAQFGRDASTPRARFAIAMEAKRYRKSLRLEDVAGKIWVAANELASDVDVWALCSTAEMGDGVLAKLEEMMEKQGISLLMLDWTGQSIPRLAVLLAAARNQVAQWCNVNTSPIVAATIDAALAVIETDAAFSVASDQLKKDASASYSGLAALAEANRVWCGRVFSDRDASRRAFGQFLTVRDPLRPAVTRASTEAHLKAALSAPHQSPECVAILGPEGTGKSWLAAQWWSTSPDQPILVIASAQVADLVDAKKPVETIARLLAAQGDGNPTEQEERWARRLRRWSNPPATVDDLRFLVLLDGLNERSGKPWAETILRLALEVAALGGRLLVTCREAFWNREVAPRLAGLKVVPVRVGDYTPEELEEVLRHSGKADVSISEDVRRFIQNPRICSVALDLLDRLSVRGDELTKERLLLEYWRRRLEERGDLVAHNVRDFEKLLHSHAKALRDNPGIQFDRDDWREHSGAAKREDGRSVEHDLSDIEEGAFLQVVEGRDGFYEFKRDTVPFALGLLIARELQDELRKPNRDAAEVIDSIIEEVQGFDLVGEALRAAAGIACFEADYPPEARAALILAWLEHQNIPDSDYEVLAAYASASPDAVLDALETALAGKKHTRREWLIGAALDKRDRVRVKEALEKRIDGWLGRWSKKPRRFSGPGQKEEERVEQQTARIANRLQSLTIAEQEFLKTACFEVSTPEATDVDKAAVLFLAGQPQAAHARALLAWAFSWVLTGDFDRADKDLSWVIWLNTKDFDEFERNLRAAASSLIIKGYSGVGQRAVAIAFRMLGTLAASSEADALSPIRVNRGWRRVEKFCEADPFDPNSARPQNLTNAIREASAIDPVQAWNHMSRTGKDWNLEMITPGLARFEPDPIVSSLRAIAKTVESREGLALRQLSWHLAELSPLFDTETLAAVSAGYKRLIEQPALVATNDQRHVAGSILLSLLPHYTAMEQLRLYWQLPRKIPDWYAFREMFKPLSVMEVESVLEETETDLPRFKRTLFFLSAHRQILTEKSRAVLVRALVHADRDVVTLASDIAHLARDDALNEQVISAARRRGEGADTCDNAFWRARAVGAAVVSLKRNDDASLIAPPFLGYAAARLGGTFERDVVNRMLQTVTRLLAPIQTTDLKLGRLFLELDHSERAPVRRVDDRAADDDEMADSIEALQARLEIASLDIDKYEERRKALEEEARTYLAQLRAEKASDLAREPDFAALARLVTLEPTQALAIADRILSETDELRLSHIRNFGLCLAEALSSTEADRAAALIAHLARVQSPITIVLGDARIPQYIRALFAGPDVPSLSMLRREALDHAPTDSDLEVLIFAAEEAGHSTWLQTWIEGEAQSTVPGRIARALMAEGLRELGSEPSALLARDWGSGFLGEVAKHARYSRERGEWARVWIERAAGTNNPVDFWRWGQLAAGIADIRTLRWSKTAPSTPLLAQYGSELFKRVREAAEKRTKKRKDTLFGLKKPHRPLSQLVDLKMP